MNLARFALFQIVWFLAVLPAARGSAWPGAAACTAFAAWHLWLVPAGRRSGEVRLLILAITLGLCVETIFGALDVLDYAAGWGRTPWAPAWILGLWAAFGALASNLLRWLRGRLLLAALLGAVGGPLSLRSGALLNALELGPATLWIPAVALEWALLTPLLIHASQQLEEHAGRPEEAVRIHG